MPKIHPCRCEVWRPADAKSVPPRWDRLCARLCGRMSWFFPEGLARCGIMIDCAASTDLSRCDERVRITAAACGERPGQGRGDPGSASPDHGPAAEAGEDPAPVLPRAPVRAPSGPSACWSCAWQQRIPAGACGSLPGPGLRTHRRLPMSISLAGARLLTRSWHSHLTGPSLWCLTNFPILRVRPGNSRQWYRRPCRRVGSNVLPRGPGCCCADHRSPSWAGCLAEAHRCAAGRRLS